MYEMFILTYIMDFEILCHNIYTAHETMHGSFLLQPTYSTGKKQKKILYLIGFKIIKCLVIFRVNPDVNSPWNT